MAHPFILEAGFERGSNADWTSETDTGSQLDFPHASELARFPWSECAPYRGAYCARFTLGANTTDASLTSTTIDIADTATGYFRFYLYLAPNFTFTADDTVSLFKLTQAAGGTVELTFGLSLTAATDAILIGGSDGTAAADFGATQLQRNRWYCVEIEVNVETNSTGTLRLWLDGTLQVSLTSLDQAAAVGDGVLGVMDRLDTTTGVILMDEFVMDDARLYPLVDRYPPSLLLTKSGTAFLGAGELDNVSLMSGAGTDCVLTVFDSAWGDVNDASKIVAELKNTANNELVDPAGMPVPVKRGAYVQLSGTNPRALVNIKRAVGYHSPALVRRAALASAGRAPGEGL